MTQEPKEPKMVDIADILVDVIEEFEAEHPGAEPTFAALLDYAEQRHAKDEAAARTPEAAGQEE